MTAPDHRNLVLAALAAALARHAGRPQLLKSTGPGMGREPVNLQPTAVCVHVERVSAQHPPRSTKTHTPLEGAPPAPARGENGTRVCVWGGASNTWCGVQFFQPTAAAEAAHDRGRVRVQVQSAPQRDGMQHTQTHTHTQCDALQCVHGGVVQGRGATHTPVPGLGPQPEYVNGRHPQTRPPCQPGVALQFEGCRVVGPRGNPTPLTPPRHAVNLQMGRTQRQPGRSCWQVAARTDRGTGRKGQHVSSNSSRGLGPYCRVTQAYCELTARRSTTTMQAEPRA